MQKNLSNLQYQQMQMLQQQQRLATTMQQKHRGYPPSTQQNWEQQQQLLQQQQRMMNSQPKEMPMMRLPHPNMMPSRPPHSQITLPSQQQQQLQQPIVPSINPSLNPVNAETTKILAVETDAQRHQLQQYQMRDEAYQDKLNLQHKRHIELAQNKKRAIEFASMERRTRMQHGPAVAFGPGYRGFGNGTTGTQSRIRFPRSKKRNQASKRETFKFPLVALEEQAKKEETLVPIRIELEHEGYKLRDTFTWNLHESLVTPEQFADVLCEDLKLPNNIFSDQIAKAIREQIDDYNLNASSMVKDEMEQPTKVEEETSAGQDQKQGIELRTVIKLDITVGNWELVDQFEWDISCPRNSPEEFAHKLATDLGLPGEFKTAIAHSIREQTHVYIKSLLLVGYEFNTSSTIDDELRHSFLPRLKRIIRDNKYIEQFTPSIIQLPDAVVEKMSKDRMREARRKRRSTRARRGVVLPDREPQKTHRTGFAVLPEQELTDEQFLLNSMADPQQQQTNKRSAALKARMNIAAEASLGDDFIENGTTATATASSNRNMQGVISFNSGNTMMKPNYQLSWQHHR